MVKLILLLLLFRIDNSSTVVDTFDRIEVNHHYNEWGAEVWTQLICWDWNPRKGVFRVEHYIMMKDAYEETEEGKKKWDKKVRDIADKIKDWMTRVDFLSSCRYRGDFVGGKYYPFKNFRTRYWEVKFFDQGFRRIIKAKIFTETHTQYDPEVADREFFPSQLRRGLTKLPINKSAVINNQEWQNFIERLVPQFNN